MLGGIMQFNKVDSVPSPTPSAPSQTGLPKKGSNWFGKKLYAVIALVMVAGVVAALLVPQGTATIPLNVDYTVGEKMFYDTTLTMTFQDYNSTLTALVGQPLNDVSVNAKQSIEVIDFDGEYYTLNHTTTSTLNEKPFSYSMIEKMNKTGYSTYLLNLGNTEQEIPNTSFTSNSYLTQLLNRSEVKVGDSVTVPFPTAVSGLGITGYLTMRFGGFEDLTVPAGTYRVFRIDVTSHNVSMNYNPSVSIAGLNLTSSMDMDLNYQIYMEYGTLRQVKSTMQEAVSYKSAMMNYTMTLSMDMTLSQHVKP
jgi:hypothetical protein